MRNFNTLPMVGSKGLPASTVRSLSPGIEPLESRIAPASLQVGLVLSSTDTEYSDSPFVNMATGTDAISNAVGHTASTYYVELGAGKAYNRIDVAGPGGTFEEFLTVKGGTIVAFFQDKNHDNEIQRDELMGLALGSKVSLVVKGNIGADVVSNFDVANDKVTTNHVLADQGIVSLSAGVISGKILTGGSIAKATFTSATDVRAGSATVEQKFAFFPGVPLSAPLTFTPASGQAGPSISNLTTTAISTIAAGNGGEGAAGGSLTNIQILGDANGLFLLAGNGGDAIPGAAKPKGGAGGKLQGLYIAGTTDNSTEAITLLAGNGGAAPAGTAGSGGAASSIFIGYTKAGKPSGELLHEQVALYAGFGGNGKIAGAGGAVSAVRIALATDNAAGNDIDVVSGGGGSSLAGDGVQAGAGGAISKVEILNRAVQNNALNAVNAQIVVDAGEGGLASANALGAKGGSITGVALLGSGLSVLGGNGSSGKAGGDGGSVSDIKILQAASIFARDVVANAGTGGNGTTGKGGRGGNIAGLKTVGAADFSSLNVNSGVAADGGDSVSGAGGIGGSVTGLVIQDSNSRGAATHLSGNAFLRTGAGGDGATAAAGGSLLNSTITTVDLTHTIRTGKGGKNLGSGNGGASGQVAGLNLVATGIYGAQTPVYVQVIVDPGGNGGTAPGNLSSGGAGGSIAKTSVVAAGSVALTAGDGGNGGGGAAGNGGSLLATRVLAGEGDLPFDALADSFGLVIAGNAGATGAKPGTGGSITGVKGAKPSGLFASRNLTIKAGNGSNGGHGGSITQFAYGGSTGIPIPSGAILVQAGGGSVAASGQSAGAGGSISSITGPAASGSTVFQAGNGAGSSARNSAGGSISKVSIIGGPEDSIFPASILSVVAGNAGNAGSPSGATDTAKGAAGGSVSNFTVTGVGPSIIIRSLAAGDGAPGRLQGGKGGSVTHVQVNDHDIGVKTGQDYGYSTMGGVFAGLGGAGGTKDGLAGNVQFIRADSISAIVAGKGSAPGLVEQVDHIVLNPGPGLLADVNGGAETQFALTFHPIVSVTTTVDGTASIPERQTITRLLGGSNAPNGLQPDGGFTTFQLTYGGQTTGLIDANADTATIQSALNGLNSIQSAGGVTLVDNAVNPNALDKGGQSFTVYFNSAGNRPLISGLGIEKTASLTGNAPAAVALALNQLPNIDDRNPNNSVFNGVTVTSTAGGGFEISFRSAGDQGAITAERAFDFSATGVPAVAPGYFSKSQNVDVVGVGGFVLYVDVGFGPEVTVRIPLNATPFQVETAINDLTGVQAVGEDVTVTAGLRSSYNVNFLFGESIIKGQEFSALTVVTSQSGGFGVSEIDVLSFPPSSQPIFLPADFAAAHIVGAIADFNELGAQRFRFIDANFNGVYDFAQGEIPIDGLIAAKKLSLSAPSNFIPQARYALQVQVRGPFVAVPAGTEFLDYDNL